MPDKKAKRGAMMYCTGCLPTAAVNVKWLIGEDIRRIATKPPNVERVRIRIHCIRLARCCSHFNRKHEWFGRTICTCSFENGSTNSNLDAYGLGSYLID
jgi:hypothetical protein